MPRVRDEDDERGERQHERREIELRDVEHDGSRIEQGEIALFIGRNLPERMNREMRRFLHRAERNQTHLVRLAHFFQRPAHARIASEAFAAVG